MSDRELEQSLLELADPCGVGELEDVARLLAQRCTRLLSVSGAAVLLADAPGGIDVRAAVPERLAALPRQAIAHGAGPAVDCYRTATAVAVPDLRRVTRWPDFTTTALGYGITAVYALPLRHRDQSLGVVALYHTTDGFSGLSGQRARLLADAASIGLAHGRERQRQRERIDQLQTALDSRVLIEQAKGILAERHGTTLTEAFHRLRGHARRNQTLLHCVARSVIDTLRAPAKEHRGSPTQ
ncbi:ANTAR domain-containing protein [Amycolatopsis anabasis]|uniref:ANTAR domain-containing protein n=1 Tax=Amycolatopsis anabasis TaxID=1840409 RepID=UPI00131CAD1D|nr:GAF and ANTAR domain-containing protein [Amycolatopsis anabasis]